MKWLTSLLSVLFLAGIMVAVPSGCESKKATEIDATEYPDAEDPEGEMGDEENDEAADDASEEMD